MVIRYDAAMIIGVLAFQGDFAEHMDVLTSLAVRSVEVRSLEDLEKVNALIIPGGESTVMAKFLEESGVGKEIQSRVKAKSLFVYGTCAGAIVIAKKATGKNAPHALGLIDIDVDRNAYGTQLESFEASLAISSIKKPISVAFIRAPKITRTGKGVEVLSEYKKDPVLVRQGTVLAGTFHPEVRGEQAIHRLFLTMVSADL
jgi:5'-phosphate synthase pdxT subunit